MSFVSAHLFRGRATRARCKRRGIVGLSVGQLKIMVLSVIYCKPWRWWGCPDKELIAHLTASLQSLCRAFRAAGRYGLGPKIVPRCNPEFPYPYHPSMHFPENLERCVSKFCKEQRLICWWFSHSQSCFLWKIKPGYDIRGANLISLLIGERFRAPESSTSQGSKVKY